MGRNSVSYSYRATLISYRSCLKPIDTFRFVLGGAGSSGPRIYQRHLRRLHRRPDSPEILSVEHQAVAA